MTNEATQRLVAAHDVFLKFVRARISDRQTALDVLQDAFVKALARVDELRDDERVVAWFYQILRTTIADLGRRKAAEARVVAPGIGETAAEGRLESQTETVATDCLRQLLPVLRGDQADLIERVELGGEAPEAYARRHGLTDATFRVRRHRARKALREAILSVCQCLIDRDADCVCASC